MLSNHSAAEWALAHRKEQNCNDNEEILYNHPGPSQTSVCPLLQKY